jgi:hypothetical protein
MMSERYAYMSDTSRKYEAYWTTYEQMFIKYIFVFTIYEQLFIYIIFT